MRYVDDITSLVIITGRNGYEAVVRFRNPRLDLVMTHRFKETLIAILSQKVRL